MAKGRTEVTSDEFYDVKPGEAQARRRCIFTGRRTVAGWQKVEKGKRRDGGVGNKVKGRTKRAVKPNLRRIKMVVDGKTIKAYVSTKAMKSGLVIKPPKKTKAA